jgi:hypothetical protein
VLPGLLRVFLLTGLVTGMFNQDTEVLFPTRVIPTLRSLHGEEWGQLIDRLQSEDCSPAERHAFVLMMVKMCGCVGCNADSFRAMRGCTQCARQSVRRNRGGDHELVEQHKGLLREVEAALQKAAAEPGSDA